MSIKFGDVVLEVLDPENIQPVMCDLMTEARLVHSTLIAVSFGAIIVDGDAKAHVAVNARLRLPLGAAADLRDMLTNTLKDAMPGRENVN